MVEVSSLPRSGASTPPRLPELAGVDDEAEAGFVQHHSGVVELIESKVKMTGDQSEDDWSQPLFLRNAKLYALHD